MQRIQERFTGLGSEIVLTLVDDNPARSAAIMAALVATVESFEQRFSRFLPGSELSLVNGAAGRPIAISPLFRSLVELALRYYRLTDGLFNPLILPDLQRAGYDRSWLPDAPDRAPRYTNRLSHPLDVIHLESNTITLPADAAIDFGGIGKGFCLSLLAEAARPISGGFWFSLGGDLVSWGEDISHRPFSIGVAAADPTHQPPVTLTMDPSVVQAVATSGILKRSGVRGGVKWHHLIDPCTHLPAETDLATVSVVASDPVVADIAAKCAVIAGSSEADRLLRRLGIEKAVLQFTAASDIQVRDYAHV